MAFQMNGTSPPAGCAPSARGYRFVEPQPSGYDGQGNPVGVAGKPYIEHTFTSLSETGWNWYMAIVGSDQSVDLTSAQVWNPYKTGGAGFQTYSTTAIFHRPKFSTYEYGAYRGVVIRITELS